MHLVRDSKMSKNIEHRKRTCTLKLLEVTVVPYAVRQRLKQNIIEGILRLS